MSHLGQPLVVLLTTFHLPLENRPLASSHALTVHMQCQGFDPSKVPTSYGDTLTFWDWKERKIVQQIKLGNDGLIPLEVMICKVQGLCER